MLLPPTPDLLDAFDMGTRESDRAPVKSDVKDEITKYMYLGEQIMSAYVNYSESQHPSSQDVTLTSPDGYKAKTQAPTGGCNFTANQKNTLRCSS